MAIIIATQARRNRGSVIPSRVPFPGSCRLAEHDEPTCARQRQEQRQDDITLTPKPRAVRLAITSVGVIGRASSRTGIR